MNRPRRDSVVSAPEPIDDSTATAALRLQWDKFTQENVSAFDQFGAHYEGPLNREELYDRSALRWW
jgi:hypothetical protein